MTDKLPPEKPTTFIELIDIFPSIAVLSRAIGQPYKRVSKWRERGLVPDEHWDAIIEAALDLCDTRLSIDDLYAMGRRARATKQGAAA